MRGPKERGGADSLWAPWRMDYILAEKKGERCIFCPQEGKSARGRLILHQSPLCLVMLNRYPYSYAHLLVAPVRHVDRVDGLKKREMAALLHSLGRSIEVLRRVFHPDGFNVGMNLGQMAGAGVLHHIHFHIVPRWQGDTNFMPALAEVRVIPEHLSRTYRKLVPHFRKLGE